jgi:hypothetical protein
MSVEGDESDAAISGLAAIVYNMQSHALRQAQDNDTMSQEKSMVPVKEA